MALLTPLIAKHPSVLSAIRSKLHDATLMVRVRAAAVLIDAHMSIDDALSTLISVLSERRMLFEPSYFIETCQARAAALEVLSRLREQRRPSLVETDPHPGASPVVCITSTPTTPTTPKRQVSFSEDGEAVTTGGPSSDATLRDRVQLAVRAVVTFIDALRVVDVKVAAEQLQPLQAAIDELLVSGANALSALRLRDSLVVSSLLTLLDSRQVALTSDSVDAVRLAVLEAIGRLGAGDGDEGTERVWYDGTVKVLLQGAKGREPLLRQAAIEAIGRLHQRRLGMREEPVRWSSQSVVVQTLLHCAMDRNEDVAKCAVVALRRAGIDQNLFSNHLLGIVNDGTAALRRKALRLLAAVKRVTNVSIVRSQLQSEDAGIRAEAVRTWGSLCKQQLKGEPEAMRALEALLADDVREVALEAAFALLGVGQTDAGVENVLLMSASDPVGPMAFLLSRAP
jgi:HEAT repeat protein